MGDAAGCRYSRGTALSKAADVEAFKKALEERSRGVNDTPFSFENWVKGMNRLWGELE